LTLGGLVGLGFAHSFLNGHLSASFSTQGNYRLNFRGRVKLPSVKNYQLVPPGDMGNVWTQFGKVTEHDFHLDFKRPLSPLLAFAFAITQFDY